MNILGIGGIRSQAAAVLISNGRLVAAVEQAKLTRDPQPVDLPHEAIAECLRIGGIKPADVHSVALARPLPPGAAIPLALTKFAHASVVSVDHHEAHAASAFYASPFENATVITLDAEGDLRCGSRWRGAGNSLTLDREIFYPDSIGDIYGRVTRLLGMRARSEEHRVQWLSAVGQPKHQAIFERIVSGQTFDQSYFDNQSFSAKFFSELGQHTRADLAASLQKTLEAYVIRLAEGAENVCLAGGVAWNALLVAALENSGRFKGIFAQPAAGNAGTALGAALYVLRQHLDGGGYGLGPEYSAAEMKQTFENCKLRFRLLSTVPEITGAAVEQLQKNCIVAWMQGRMEFGPRALGHRSILASPHDPYSTENLNTFIKHREASRKFAASVPAELAGRYFETGENARHLATVGKVRQEHRDQFRGAILAEDLVRVHTVSKEDNPLYWQLLHAFGDATGLPVLYNTSFNLFGEQMVCTPRDAVRSFYASGIDALVAGNFLLEK
ncbi:MAG: Carbamoyltransferase [Bryobacterales bacterium]|nr:Carbamoyltransferase [Bryobacterales bacterium]